MARATLFLETGHYRRRRLMDAIRLLPFFGLALWLVPLMWSHPSEEPIPEASGTSMAAAILYIFGVWALLSLVAFGIWLRTRSRDEVQEQDDP